METPNINISFYSQEMFFKIKSERKFHMKI